MTKKEIMIMLMTGAEVSKSSYTKFKRNKVVRGSFYDYRVGDYKITQKQFESIYDQLSSIPCTHQSIRKYKLTDYLDYQPF